MIAIYKKELHSYFNSMMGYVVVAFVLSLTGFYFSAYNLGYRYPLLGYSLSALTFLFLIIVPIITMRSLSEEQKNKTDQLLYTSPISIHSIIIGKYLALLTVFVIPLLFVCTFPLIMGKYGAVDFKMSYLAIFGFFLLGAAYLAIGLFISSVTESQIIAAVISFGVLVFTYLVSAIASFFSNTALTSLLAFGCIVMLLCLGYYWMVRNTVIAGGVFVVAELTLILLYQFKTSLFEGLFPKILNTLDLTAASNNMIQNGILDLNNIVFYLSVIGLFLFFTVQSIQKKRWS